MAQVEPQRDQTRQELKPKYMAASHQMRMLLTLLFPYHLLKLSLLPSSTPQFDSASKPCSHTSLLSSFPVKSIHLFPSAVEQTLSVSGGAQIYI